MAQIMLRDYVQETEDAISAGHAEDALSRCQRILARFPEFLEVQRLMGEVYLAQGKLEEAQHAFDWVLINDPENVVTYCDRALTSERLSDYDTALDCYQQAYELSRGNSQIRSEFNKLSTRVGQQGFMLSRAGLARLYMRGDLLAQAIQEWEAVLVTTPDRLDARIGLLEAYWREGFYDRAEQLACQILNDVPGCLKARLLLAHVISMRDMAQASEFLQQTRALDPDLVMAQELFADAALPGQFVQLIKQAPAMLEPGEDAALSQSKTSSDIPTRSGFEVWDDPNPASSPLPELQQANDPPVWVPSNILGMNSPQPQQETVSSSSPALSSSGSGDEWSPPSPDELPSPSPTWLNMLTQQDRQQMSSAFPPVPSLVERGVSSSKPSVVPPENVPAHSARQEKSDEVTSPSELEEASFFGPEWLKSIGAAAYTEDDTHIEPAAKMRDEDLPIESGQDGDFQQPQALLQPEEAPRQESVEREQKVLSTLEELEQSLRLQGFVSHEPHSLASLSHAIGEEAPRQQPEGDQYDTDLSSALAELGNLKAQLERPSNAGATAENIQAQTSFPMKDQEQQEPAPAPSQESQEADMPEWVHALHEATKPEHFEESQPPRTTRELQSPAPTTSQRESQNPADTAPAREHIPTNPAFDEHQSSSLSGRVASEQSESAPSVTPVFEPTARQAADIPPAAQSTTFVHPEPLLEGELETTMRRPAVRLQHLQSRVMAQRESARKGQQAAELSAARAAGKSAGYQERLLKGYQYQLAGDYDEAMQEYRVLIKGAPELLGEVISNVRALLRLAPKYSAGYRVLGDAYMRQGEYLQAMEAYNKALTMAKRARG